MILNIPPVVFGAMYGYTPVHKRSQADAWKFGAIFTPMVYLTLVNEGLDNRVYTPKKVSPLVSCLVLAPLFVGWRFCVGSALGRYGRERLTDGGV